MLFDITVDKDVAARVIKGMEFIESERDLLINYGIWDEASSSKIFSLICEHTSLCTTVMNSDDGKNILR